VCEQGGDEHVGQPALVGLWGGALYLAAELARAGRGERTICQLTTASHISRLTGPATVRVFLRARASVAALPASHLEECHRRLDALLPGQLGRAESVLEADLANLNAILHPTSRLGVRAVPFAKLFCQLGFTTDKQAHAGGAYHAIQDSELIRPVQSPPRLDHRYLHEDVGWGLVPWMHLATATGSPAPTITALTQLAGVINGIDYPRQGLTLERMGLAGKTASEIRAHVGAPTAELARVPATSS